MMQGTKMLILMRLSKNESGSIALAEEFLCTHAFAVTCLNELKEGGYVQSRMEQPSPEKVGPVFYSLTTKGAEAVKEFHSPQASKNRE